MENKKSVDQKERDTLLSYLAKAMDQQGTALCFTDTDGEGVHFIQGNPLDIIVLIVRGMVKDKRIAFIIEKAAEYKRDVMDKRSGAKTESLHDLFGHDPLDCDSCPSKGKCEIESEVRKMKSNPNIVPPPDDFLRDLFKCFEPTDLERMAKEMLIKKTSRKN